MSSIAAVIQHPASTLYRRRPHSTPLIRSGSTRASVIPRVPRRQPHVERVPVNGAVLADERAHHVHDGVSLVTARQQHELGARQRGGGERTAERLCLDFPAGARLDLPCHTRIEPRRRRRRG